MIDKPGMPGSGLYFKSSATSDDKPLKFRPLTPREVVIAQVVDLRTSLEPRRVAFEEGRDALYKNDALYLKRQLPRRRWALKGGRRLRFNNSPFWLKRKPVSKAKREPLERRFIAPGTFPSIDAVMKLLRRGHP